MMIPDVNGGGVIVAFPGLLGSRKGVAPVVKPVTWLLTRANASKMWTKLSYNVFKVSNYQVSAKNLSKNSDYKRRCWLRRPFLEKASSLILISW